MPLVNYYRKRNPIGVALTDHRWLSAHAYTECPKVGVK